MAATSPEVTKASLLLAVPPEKVRDLLLTSVRAHPFYNGSGVIGKLTDEEVRGRMREAIEKNDGTQATTTTATSVPDHELSALAKIVFLDEIYTSLTIPQSHVDACSKALKTLILSLTPGESYYTKKGVKEYTRLVAERRSEMRSMVIEMSNLMRPYSAKGTPVPKEVISQMEGYRTKMSDPPSLSASIVWSCAASIDRYPPWMEDILVRAFAALYLANKAKVPRPSILVIEKEITLFLINTRETILFPREVVGTLLKEIEARYDTLSAAGKSAVVLHPDDLNASDKKKMDSDIAQRLGMCQVKPSAP